MAKIRVNENIDPERGKKWHHTQYFYFCPGCEKEHCFGLKSDGGHHQFNGDIFKPTVTPSLVQDFVPGEKCHSYIKAGRIQFLNDCYHKLKGQTVELPEISQ